VPAGPIVLTAGVDVQKDRFVYEVVGWAPNKESWSVDAGELYGDTALESTWAQLDALLGRTYSGDDGSESPISSLAVDSGYNTQMVYGWARQHPMPRVIACKGVAGARMLVGSPSAVEVTTSGKHLRRGYKVWPIGVDIAKSELYGWLRLRIGELGVAPPGYCHFPEYSEGYFQQLTAEHLATSVNRRTGRTKLEWQVLPNRENHFLDARVYARAAAAVLGIDRMAPREPKPRVAAASSPNSPAAAPSQAPAAPAASSTERKPAPFLKGNRPRGEWFGKRR
jgi:phage terminase large subunit GpA-like protein